MRRTERLLRRADAWVFAPEDARRLAAVRIGLCSLLALRLAIANYGIAADRPAFFQPHFYMDFFERMPSQGAATALQFCGIVAALVAAAGIALRISLPVAFVCSLVLNGMLNSTGRVIVGDAALTLCVLVLVASGAAAADAWSIRARGHPPPRGARYGWPVRTAMIVLALAYFFAGFQKWRYSGLAWATSDNLRWILYASSDGQAHANGLALFVADRPLLAHALAVGTLLLETGFPLVLFVPKLRWLFIPAAVSMHIGIWIALRLDYSAQWLTAVIVFVNWPIVLAHVRRTLEAVPASRAEAG